MSYNAGYQCRQREISSILPVLVTRGYDCERFDYNPRGRCIRPSYSVMLCNAAQLRATRIELYLNGQYIRGRRLVIVSEPQHCCNRLIKYQCLLFILWTDPTPSISIPADSVRGKSQTIRFTEFRCTIDGRLEKALSFPL